MKYIIDIEDNAFEQDNCPDMLFRAKGFKSLVFDQNGLDKLAPYEEWITHDCSQKLDQAYHKGLCDAWEVVKKVSRMDTETAERITGYSSLFNIMNNITPEEAIAKVKAYEQYEQEIRIGDQVIAVDKDSVGSLYEPFIVYKISETSVFGIGEKSGTHIMNKTDVKKTGRHYDMVKILMDAKKG